MKYKLSDRLRMKQINVTQTAADTATALRLPTGIVETSTKVWMLMTIYIRLALAAGTAASVDWQVIAQCLRGNVGTGGTGNDHLFANRIIHFSDAAPVGQSAVQGVNYWNIPEGLIIPDQDITCRVESAGTGIANDAFFQFWYRLVDVSPTDLLSLRELG